jgi:Zn-dependent protease with chaperone function
MAGEDQDTVNGGNGNGGGDGGGGEARARRIFTDISSRSWEHPADRAALAALRKLPVFDEVLKRLFGFFGEKPTRLAFQANAVKVSERQFPRIHAIYQDVCRTLDAPEEYDLFISQTPIVNAGAYGMAEPFIILNSGTVILLEDDELQYVLGHELAHIMSGHVLYRTMMYLLIQLANMGFPIVGLAARAVLMALLEWYRKSELSCDRAGLLTVQDPELVMQSMMKMAGGIPGSTRPDTGEMDLDAFILQAEEYKTGGDVADHVFKILNLLGTTHPFYVLRVAEIRAWIESGDYDRILRGEYARREDTDPAYKEDLRAAAQSYAEGTKDFVDSVAGAAKRMSEAFIESLRR